MAPVSAVSAEQTAQRVIAMLPLVAQVARLLEPVLVVALAHLQASVQCTSLNGVLA